MTSGYQLRPFTAGERRESDRWACTVRGCRSRPTYVAMSRYVVRQSEKWSERRMCDDHAAGFASRHGVYARAGGVS